MKATHSFSRLFRVAFGSIAVLASLAACGGQKGGSDASTAAVRQSDRFHTFEVNRDARIFLTARRLTSVALANGRTLAVKPGELVLAFDLPGFPEQTAGRVAVRLAGTRVWGGKPSGWQVVGLQSVDGSIYADDFSLDLSAKRDPFANVHDCQAPGTSPQICGNQTLVLRRLCLAQGGGVEACAEGREHDYGNRKLNGWSTAFYSDLLGLAERSFHPVASNVCGKDQECGDFSKELRAACAANDGGEACTREGQTRWSKPFYDSLVREIEQKEAVKE